MGSVVREAGRELYTPGNWLIVVEWTYLTGDLTMQGYLHLVDLI